MSVPPPVDFLSASPWLPSGDDFDASVDFYVNTLGFNMTYRSDGPAPMAVMARGDVRLYLARFADQQYINNTMLLLQVDDVDRLHQQYVEKGILPYTADVTTSGITDVNDTDWGSREFVVRDVAGVCIHFYQWRSYHMRTFLQFEERIY